MPDPQRAADEFVVNESAQARAKPPTTPAVLPLADAEDCELVLIVVPEHVHKLESDS